MILLLLGMTLDLVGTVMLGYTVLAVHAHIIKEHRLDGDVFEEMKKERNVAFAGLFLITLGYVLQMAFYSLI